VEFFNFVFQRIAYMAASQSFHADLDVLMLATNLIKKVCHLPMFNIRIREITVLKTKVKNSL